MSIRELHNSIVAVYADSTARVLDARMKCLSQEIKTAVPGQPIGTVRLVKVFYFMLILFLVL